MNVQSRRLRISGTVIPRAYIEMAQLWDDPPDHPSPALSSKSGNGMPPQTTLLR